MLVQIEEVTRVYRLECLYKKGGKRPFGDTSDEYGNPCFNITDNKTESNNDGFWTLVIS